MGILLPIMQPGNKIIETTIDLAFPVEGEQIPTQHAYALFSAISNRVSALHDADIRYRMSTLPCIKPEAPQPIGRLAADAILRFRISVTDLPHFLLLSHQTFQVDGCQIRLGAPVTHRLQAYPCLISRIVVIKGFQEPVSFLEAVQRQLSAHSINADFHILDDAQGEPKRRILHIQKRQIVGFPVVLSNLTAESSLLAQAFGVGGRGKLGGGFFQPLRPLYTPDINKPLTLSHDA